MASRTPYSSHPSPSLTQPNRTSMATSQLDLVGNEATCNHRPPSIQPSIHARGSTPAARAPSPAARGFERAEARSERGDPPSVPTSSARLLLFSAGPADGGDGRRRRVPRPSVRLRADPATAARASACVVRTRLWCVARGRYVVDLSREGPAARPAQQQQQLAPPVMPGFLAPPLPAPAQSPASTQPRRTSGRRWTRRCSGGGWRTCRRRRACSPTGSSASGRSSSRGWTCLGSAWGSSSSKPTSSTRKPKPRFQGLSLQEGLLLLC
ncbi:hypothetical protein VPH35_091004 [Triticum aestivum]